MSSGRNAPRSYKTATVGSPTATKRAIRGKVARAIVPRPLFIQPKSASWSPATTAWVMTGKSGMSSAVIRMPKGSWISLLA
ncbi:hypothetical protein D3C78_1682110 [compost metagenome]